jgi:polysaccharide export outer membrane protein
MKADRPSAPPGSRPARADAAPAIRGEGRAKRPPAGSKEAGPSRTARPALRRARRTFRPRSAPVPLFWPIALLAIGACGRQESTHWLANGFIDPTQVGQFQKPRRTEIRSVLSILEEPIGIQNTEEPTPEDLLPDYQEQKLMPGDVVNVSIFELLIPGESTGQQIRVSPSGYETLPVLGRVRIAGLTPRELELHLKELLRNSQILEDAEVQVALVESRGAQYSVIGSIQRAGTYVLPSPEFRLLNAVAEVGGVPPQLEKIYIFRRGAVPGGPLPIEPPAPADTQPAAQASLPLNLSDVSSSQAATAPSRPSPVTPTAPSTAPQPEEETSGLAADSAVDELRILEGGPTGSQPAIDWDPVRGEWVVQPLAGRRSAAGLGSTTARWRTSGPDSGPATSGAPEEEPEEEVAEAEELAPPVRILEIPIKDLLDGDPRYNVVIRPYDLINVPPGHVGEYYMMGNINRNGAYDLTGRRLTVKEAIAAAGGFGALAWPSRADLVRRISKDEEQVIQLDLDAIFAGDAPDFYLRPNDIVNVGTTPQALFLAVLRNAFRFSYGFGFVYDRNFADSDSFQAREAVKTRRNQEALARGLPTN